MRLSIAFRVLKAKASDLEGLKAFGSVVHLFPGALGDMGHRYRLDLASHAMLGPAFSTLKADPNLQYVEVIDDSKPQAVAEDDSESQLQGAMP